MNHGTSLGELGRGLGTKENVLLGRAGSKETGQGVGLESGNLPWISKGWSFHKETQKGTLLPISLSHSQS